MNKFKIWDHESKLMSAPVSLDWFIMGDGDLQFPATGETLPLKDFIFYYREKPHNYVFLPFSDATDNSGNEIYAGDIVETHAFRKDHRHEVYFKDAIFRAKGTDYYLTSIYFKGGPCKVIGNIYEHPELLK